MGWSQLGEGHGGGFFGYAGATLPVLTPRTPTLAPPALSLFPGAGELHPQHRLQLTAGGP